MQASHIGIQHAASLQAGREARLQRVLNLLRQVSQWESVTRSYFELNGVLTDGLVSIFEKLIYISYVPLIRAIFETTSVEPRYLHRLVLAAARYDQGPSLQVIKEARNPTNQTPYSIDVRNTQGQTPLGVAILNASGDSSWAVAVAALLEAGAALRLVPNGLDGFKIPPDPEGFAIRERLSRLEQAQLAGDLESAQANSPRARIERILQNPQPQLPHSGEIVGEIPRLSHGEFARITVRFTNAVEAKYWIFAPGNLAVAPAETLRAQMEQLFQCPQPNIPDEGDIEGEVPSLGYGESAQITVRLPDGSRVQCLLYAP